MRKYMKKLVIFICVLTLIGTSAAPASAASCKRLSKTKATIAVGCSTTIKAYGGKAKWSSSNKKVATVNSKGKVTAIKRGTATITAKIGSKKLKCVVTVKKNEFYGKVNWNSKRPCNAEEGYCIKVAPVKLWYDSKGRLNLYIIVKNETKGKNYNLTCMSLEVLDNKGRVLADSDFVAEDFIIKASSSKKTWITFSKEHTLRNVDLNKINTISFSTLVASY